MSLSPAQQGAVGRRNQDVCCVAGPGSGKTFVLVERFAALVASGLEPAKVLAITFTDKAATQIKERLVKRFDDQRDIRRAVERAQVSTIHGLCNALLSEHAIRAGLDPQFKVIDELAAGMEQASAMDRVLDSLLENRRAEFLELAAKWKSENLSGDLLRVFPRIRTAGGAARALGRLPMYEPMAKAATLARDIEVLLATPAKQTPGTVQREQNARQWIARLETEDLLEWSKALPFRGRTGAAGDPIKESIILLKEQLAAVRREAIGAAHQHLLPLVRDIFTLFEEEYARRKRALAALDFDDLEEKALALLDRDSVVRSLVQERFDAILMDELQDTNPIQWQIVDRIRRPGRFFAVGDLNQSIFRFRSAEPELFRQYRETVENAGGAVDILQENYRSRQPILDAAVSVLVPVNRGVAAHSLLGVKQFPVSGEPAVEMLRVGADDNEFLWVASRLRALYGTLMIGEEGEQRPARFSDMAILARAKTSFPKIQDALGRFGIPYFVERGSNFFEEPAIIDLVNLMRVLQQPDDDIALFGVLRSPLFGVSDEEIALLRLERGLAPPAAAARLDALRRVIIDAPPQPALAQFLDETGYWGRLGSQAHADAVKFFTLLDGLAEDHPGDLEEWLQQIDQMRADGKETTAPILEAGDAVTVLSIHKSKGLEYPIVAVVNLHSPTRSDTNPVGFHASIGLGLRWRDPADPNQGIEDPVLNAVRGLDSRQQEGEDDRLLYVAMTRAEERLLLSWRDTSRGRKSEWPRMIEAGLAQAISPGFASMTDLSGQPDIPPPPVLADVPSPPAVVPLRQDPPDTGAVAVTSLSVFASCPWRYYLQSVVAWPQPDLELEVVEGSTEPGGTSFGTRVHDALAGLPADEAAHQMAANFINSDLGRRASRALRTFKEFDFLVELEGYLLRGQIDLWFEEPAGVVLVDYKTDRSLTPERLTQYEMQLRFYALALRKLTGELPVEVWLFDLRASKPQPVSLNVSELDDCLAAWRGFQAIRAGGNSLHDQANSVPLALIPPACVQRRRSHDHHGRCVTLFLPLLQAALPVLRPAAAALPALCKR